MKATRKKINRRRHTRRSAQVADVFTTINEIQRTWSYLEPLFIHSDEVKRELPVDAERFAGIDVEIKDILTTSVTQRQFP